MALSHTLINYVTVFHFDKLSLSDYFCLQKIILNVFNSSVHNANYRFVHLWDVYETVDVY